MTHQPCLNRRENFHPALDHFVDDVEQRPFAERLQVERVQEFLERSLLDAPARENADFLPGNHRALAVAAIASPSNR